jgi:hypothetical protein
MAIAIVISPPGHRHWLSPASYIASFLALTSLSHGAIFWTTPDDISTDFPTFEASIANNGTFVSAYNFGTSSDVTINSVTFTGLGTSSTSGYNSVTGSFSITPASDSGGTTTVNYTGSASVFTDLGVAEKTLLSSYITGNDGGDPQGYEVELENLTLGQEYQIQIWVSDSRAATIGSLSDRTGAIVDGPAVDHNTSNVEGGLGQYVIGSFTATDTTESFTYLGSTENGSGYIPLNAFSLRAVPEPASAALLGGLAALALVFRRRR